MLSSLSNCRLCPRQCGADRINRQHGFCAQTGKDVHLARAALHYWEEPCISGSRGSGTVFFTGCTMRCCYCQNAQLWHADGISVSVERLCDIFVELQEKGAHNINLVSPTPYVLQIIEAVKLARQKGMRLPIVYNTGGYETKETIYMLKDTVDIYLTDFKYASDELAMKYSGCADYSSVAKEALAAMVANVGRAKFDENGIMQKGVIVRHLLLPGHGRDSRHVLRYISQTYGNLLHISLMQQYTPMRHLPYTSLNRRVSNIEYFMLCRYARKLGFTKGYFQRRKTASKSFIPSFDGFGVEKGGSAK